MKYVVIIIEGAADQPLDELGGKTPLETADAPHLARLASVGRVGEVVTTPEGFGPSPDVAAMSLLGYDPRAFHTGRAPLQAASLGAALAEGAWALHADLIPLDGDRVLDDAGVITDTEARALFTDLSAYWRRHAPDLAPGLTLAPLSGASAVLIDASGREHRAGAAPPWHAVGDPWRRHVPAGAVRSLMELSAQCFATHDVNAARVEQGLPPASIAWLHGPGRRASMPPFKERFGVRASAVTPAPWFAGLAACMGWSEGPRSDRGIAALGRDVVDSIARSDLVCCHAGTPAEAALRGDWRAKVGAIETIDREVVGPVVRALEEYGDPAASPAARGWRVLVTPGVATLSAAQRHDAAPVPFLMAGAWVRSAVQRPFSEAGGAESDLHIEPGHDLMEYFLRGGLANVGRGRTR